MSEYDKLLETTKDYIAKTYKGINGKEIFEDWQDVLHLHSIGEIMDDTLDELIKRVTFAYTGAILQENPKVKTVGGFNVRFFRKIEPIELQFNPKEPHIYAGILTYKVPNKKDLVTIECTWNELGKCVNDRRTDCFLDLKTIPKFEP